MPISYMSSDSSKKQKGVSNVAFIIHIILWLFLENDQQHMYRKKAQAYQQITKY